MESRHTEKLERGGKRSRERESSSSREEEEEEEKHSVVCCFIIEFESGPGYVPPSRQVGRSPPSFLPSFFSLSHVVVDDDGM